MNRFKPKESIASSDPEVASLPLWLVVMGCAAILGSLAVDARLIWEQTALTWAEGPQLVGLSLGHVHPVLFLLSVLFPVGLAVWLVLAIGLIALKLLSRQRISLKSTVLILAAICALVPPLLPYGFWQRLFVDRLVVGSNVGEFMTYASATGDISTVSALVSHGVSVNSRDREGQTGLHAAAATGELRVIEYLVDNGADVNAIDRFGDSPMEVAMSHNHTDTAQYVANRGGRRIRGDEATRHKAIEEIVREEIEKTNSAPNR